jgi:hypothetical protein
VISHINQREIFWQFLNVPNYLLIDSYPDLSRSLSRSCLKLSAPDGGPLWLLKYWAQPLVSSQEAEGGPDERAGVIPADIQVVTFF